MIRLITSGLIVFGVLAAVVGVSVAVFTDQAAITESQFTTGTVELDIAPNTEGPLVDDTDDSPGSFNATSISGPIITDLLPTEIETFEFWLRNSTTDGDVSLSLNTAVAAVGTPDPDVSANLLISFACDDDGDGVITGDDPAIGPTPLGTWASGPFVPGFSLAPTIQRHCRMNATLGSGATAEGASASFNATFTGSTPP